MVAKDWCWNLFYHGDDMGKKLLLVGATGLVGTAVMRLALADARVSQVVAVSRKPLSSDLKAVSFNAQSEGAIEHANDEARLLNPVVDFDHLPEDAFWWKADSVICTLGTTIKIAKSEEAFRHVDLHIPSRVASIVAQNGVQCFVLNSSMMANPKAGGLYLRTKGQAEQAVKNSGIPCVVLARPGLLDGGREERRLGEEIGILASRVFNPLLPKRLRSVKVQNLARVMLENAIRPQPGCTVLESECFQ